MKADPVPTHLKIAVGVAGAAELIDLSPETIRRLVAAGHLKRVPHTDRVLIARVELDRFAHENLSASASNVVPIVAVA